MQKYNWDIEKNEILKRTRNISFEDVVEALENDRLVDVIKSPNKTKYPDQLSLVIKANSYMYVVPFVIQEDGYGFLKLSFQVGKLLKKYFMKKIRLDKEERELLKIYEDSGFKSAPNAKQLMKQAVAMAKAMPKTVKNKTVTLRISEDDLNQIKLKANKKGIPYQTLLTSLIHHYNTDQVKLNIV